MKKARNIILILLCISLIVGAYYFLTHRASQKDIENSKELTEIEKVLTKNLSASYPQTPREVVKFYNRIISCLYNEECTDEQIEQLAEQERLLMDDELLEQNPKDSFISALKTDVAGYKSREEKITNTNVCDSADIILKKVNGADCAYVTSSYFMKVKSSDFERSVQEYVLRKDDSGNWKIMGFYLKEGDSSDE